MRYCLRVNADFTWFSLHQWVFDTSLQKITNVIPTAAVKQSAKVLGPLVEFVIQHYRTLHVHFVLLARSSPNLCGDTPSPRDRYQGICICMETRDESRGRVPKHNKHRLSHIGLWCMQQTSLITLTTPQDFPQVKWDNAVHADYGHVSVHIKACEGVTS